MGLAILAEALARIEHKLDLILTRLGFLDQTPMPQVHFIGTPCPLCKQVIDYQIDMNHNVVVRKCGCKTGKLPPLIPLIPLPGVQNGNPASDQDPTAAQAGGRPSDRPWRKEG